MGEAARERERDLVREYGGDGKSRCGEIGGRGERKWRERSREPGEKKTRGEKRRERGDVRSRAQRQGEEEREMDWSGEIKADVCGRRARMERSGEERRSRDRYRGAVLPIDSR